MPLASMEPQMGGGGFNGALGVEEHGGNYKNSAACMASPKDGTAFGKHQIIVKQDYEVSLASRQPAR